MERETCRRYLGMLSDYLDNALEEQVCRELEAHLRRCPDCRVVVDTTRRTIYLYRAVAEEERALPQAVRQRLFARLDLEAFRRGERGAHHTADSAS